MGDAKVCWGLMKVVISEEAWRAADNTPIPLVSVDINASLVHAVAQVEVSQVYANQEEQPIEAIYYFPVNPDGAVTHFQAELDGRTIKGTVKPQEEAEEVYKKAVRNKNSVFLGQETMGDIFKVRIGYLKPGSRAKVIIGYVTEVKNEPGTNEMRFYIPTTVAPRYVSPSEIDEIAEELKAMKFSTASPAPLSLKVAVSIQGKIKSINCPTHSVKVERIGALPEKPIWEKALVTLSGETTDMDRDFVLMILPEEIHTPRLYSQKSKNGSTAMMLHLVPSFKLDEQKAEILFVLDRSGSMQGSGIDLAKRALVIFLHSLPVDCYFNVIGFGNTYEFLFPRSVKYDCRSLKEAVIHATGLEADLGGTEILKPLKAIHEQPKIDRYSRQIFVLTDGQVSNTDAVIGITQWNAHKARVFALGIGPGVSHHLVEGLAKAGGGSAAFVTYNESIESKVLNQLKNGLQPSLTDIELEWEGVTSLNIPKKNETDEDLNCSGFSPKIRQSPKRIPPVYDGSQLVAFALFQDQLPSAVNVKAQSPDGLLTLKIEYLPENDIGSNEMLHKMTAVKLIRELELELAGLHFQKRPTPGRMGEVEEEIIEIGCENGITSKYTCFVAIDTDISLDTQSDENWVMESRHVPSEFPCCESQLDIRLMFKKRKYAKFAREEEDLKYDLDVHTPLAVKTDVEVDSKQGADDKKVDDVTTSILQLTSIQSFDGSYTLDEKLSNYLGKSLDDLKQGGDTWKIIKSLTIHRSQILYFIYPFCVAASTSNLEESVFATALVIAWFATKFQVEKEIWDLVEKKARKWLANAIPARNLEKVIETASNLLFVWFGEAGKSAQNV